MTLQDLMADPIIGDLRTPKLSVGEIATDFALRPLGWVQETVRLSQLQGERPVALGFGSYTCPPFRAHLAAVNQPYRRYRDRVAFFPVRQLGKRPHE